MTSIDIINIIEACGKNNVEKFIYKNFEISFHKVSEWTPVVHQEVKQPVEEKNHLDADDETMKKLHGEAIEEENFELKEEQLAQMNLEYPDLYDEYMNNPENWEEIIEKVKERSNA